MKFVVPAWRWLQDLSPIETTFVAKRRLSSHPATLTVTCMPGMTNFALTEQTQANVWRWAAYSSNGILLAEGWEPTLEGAQNVGVETQRLWTHRCDARGLCRCAPKRAER